MNTTYIENFKKINLKDIGLEMEDFHYFRCEMCQDYNREKWESFWEMFDMVHDEYNSVALLVCKIFYIRINRIAIDEFANVDCELADMHDWTQCFDALPALTRLAILWKIGKEDFGSDYNAPITCFFEDQTCCCEFYGRENIYFPEWSAEEKDALSYLSKKCYSELLMMKSFLEEVSSFKRHIISLIETEIDNNYGDIYDYKTLERNLENETDRLLSIKNEAINLYKKTERFLMTEEKSDETIFHFQLLQNSANTIESCENNMGQLPNTVPSVFPTISVTFYTTVSSPISNEYESPKINDITDGCTTVESTVCPDQMTSKIEPKYDGATPKKNGLSLLDGLVSMKITKSSNDYYIVGVKAKDTKKVDVEQLRELWFSLVKNGYLQYTQESLDSFVYRFSGKKVKDSKIVKIIWKDPHVEKASEEYRSLMYFIKHVMQASGQLWEKMSQFFINSQGKDIFPEGLPINQRGGKLPLKDNKNYLSLKGVASPYYNIE